MATKPGFKTANPKVIIYANRRGNGERIGIGVRTDILESASGTQITPEIIAQKGRSKRNKA
jgi:hypothetical protein